MLARSLILFLISFYSVCSFAGQCLMSEALKDAKLAHNDKFWEEYGVLASKGDIPDAQMKALIDKHGGFSSNSAIPTATPVQKSLTLSINHKAEKEIKSLQPVLRQKVDDFVSAALKPGGMQEIRNNPGKWHFEKLHGADAYTVRLNDGYRVMFQLEGDALKILRVNAAQIHGI